MNSLTKGYKHNALFKWQEAQSHGTVDMEVFILVSYYISMVTENFEVFKGACLFYDLKFSNLWC
jgi:hypothetical protein